MIKLCALITVALMTLSLTALFRYIYFELSYPIWDRQAQKRKKRWRACWVGAMCAGLIMVAITAYLNITTPITGG